ncbi:PEP/pyruvate-binding domain-containing protein [Flammeovirgaceae bacterium SG7u.111]|nr:PEP/pyruvate-binding domain-containing protein [Flammeovirgaceae bacterium SG7u.132]WPO33131.1 PEP/pyruvate-binding domain-containing protein [Flammeovirgaceae bacterium SG7u.111]
MANIPAIVRSFGSTYLLIFLLSTFGFAQNIYIEKKFQFLSFEKIPTWVGVAANWEKASPSIHLYDGSRYKGHAEYISKGLQTGISFQQFKDQVRNPQTRKYMPFFLFDLRGMNIQLGGTNYNWALRMEDYRYLDNPQQMQETCLRLLNTVAQYINQQAGGRSKGILILPTYEKATPNTSIAPAINQRGYPNLTLGQLASKAGGKKIEVLNAGTAFGYLRYVSKNNTEFQPSPQDILIYEELPQRVPPVGGIITLQPQTPLSHINLLAKNRGTINLYVTDLKSLLHADELINKLVKIGCSERKVFISEASMEEAKAFWAKRVVKVAIPQPKLSVSSIVDLNMTNTQQGIPFVGAKAANYALIRQSLPAYVRQGYAIPFTHYFTTIKNCGADKLIQALASQKLQRNDRNAFLKKIRETILAASIDKSLLLEVNTLISQKFNNAKIRLRSSTNCEDLPEFNGAGLYESKGFKKADGDEVLERKILQVYASLWSPLAYEEREYYFIDHAKVGMAILINQAFPDEYANGVALSMVEKENISIYINSQFGENAVTNPENGQIPESIIFPNGLKDNYNVRTRSNIHDVFAQPFLKHHLSVLKKAALEIHYLLTQRAEKREDTSFGIDIEFKLMEEAGQHKLYIKQARLLQVILPSH